jgi:peptide-methionine (S)-S-oxide reductase
MAWFDKKWKTQIVPAADALPGRRQIITPSDAHFVNGKSLTEIPDGHDSLVLAMGCFWGAERLFWEIAGVYSTSVGYAGGVTPNPTYSEVCSGATGHAEVVRVVFDPNTVSLEDLLKAFWEGHDPTQGMRQGNDVGTQYRSALYWINDDQKARIEMSRDMFQSALDTAGRGAITTEIAKAGPYYFAEDDHQQYLAKNPGGYCGLRGTGVVCAIGAEPSPA